MRQRWRVGRAVMPRDKVLYQTHSFAPSFRTGCDLGSRSPIPCGVQEAVLDSDEEEMLAPQAPTMSKDQVSSKRT